MLLPLQRCSVFPRAQIRHPARSTFLYLQRLRAAVSSLNEGPDYASVECFVSQYPRPLFSSPESDSFPCAFLPCEMEHNNTQQSGLWASAHQGIGRFLSKAQDKNNVTARLNCIAATLSVQNPGRRQELFDWRWVADVDLLMTHPMLQIGSPRGFHVRIQLSEPYAAYGFWIEGRDRPTDGLCLQFVPVLQLLTPHVGSVR